MARVFTEPHSEGRRRVFFDGFRNECIDLVDWLQDGQVETIMGFDDHASWMILADARRYVRTDNLSANLLHVVLQVSETDAMSILMKWSGSGWVK